MVAWGTAVFDNDNACDWGTRLERSQDLSLVAATVQSVLNKGNDYLEAPEAEEALAAIEVLARSRGHWGPRNEHTQVVDEWVERMHPAPSAELLEQARQALARIMSAPCELLELWQETGKFESWSTHVRDLKRRLDAG